MERLTVSFWDRHPEVAAFVTSLLATVPQTEIRERIIKRFGPDKAPSKSALGRFACEWKVLNQPALQQRRLGRFKGR